MNEKYYYSKFFPRFILERYDLLNIDSVKVCFSKISDIPTKLLPGWINRIFQYKVNLYLRIKAVPSMKVIKRMDNRKRNLLTNIKHNRKLEKYESEPNDALSQAEEFKRKIQSGSEKAFFVDLGFMSLKKDQRKIRDLLRSADIHSNIDYLSQKDSLKGLLNINANNSKYIFDITTLAYVMCVNGERHFDPTGILYSQNLFNTSLVILDRFKLHNHNGIIVGTSGSGKSFTAKLEIIRLFMSQVDICVIDPEGEYSDLCKSLNGQNLQISFDKPLPLKMTFDSYEETLSNIFYIMKLLFKLNHTDEALLEKSLEEYLKSNKSFDIDKFYESVSENLQLKMYRYVKGSCKNVFRGQDTDVTSPFTVFNIKDIPLEFKDVYIFAIINSIWNRIKNSNRRFMLFIDEAWIITRNPQAVEFINSITKRIRKYNGGVTFITQDINDFLSTEYGKTILTNCSYKLILRQESSELKLLKSKLNLSDFEKDFLLSAQKGEGIMSIGENKFPVRSIYHEYETNLIK